MIGFTPSFPQPNICVAFDAKAPISSESITSYRSPYHPITIVSGRQIVRARARQRSGLPDDGR